MLKLISQFIYFVDFHNQHKLYSLIFKLFLEIKWLSNSVYKISMKSGHIKNNK